MDVYLMTRPGGRHFFADRIVAAGETVQAVAPEAPYPARGLRAATSPELALLCFPSSWPCETWRASGEPVEQLGEGLYRFDTLLIGEALNPAQALGVNRERILRLFAGL